MASRDLVDFSDVLDILYKRLLLVILFIENCCVLSDSQYVCAVSPPRNLRRLRAISGTVPISPHLTGVPSTMSIETGPPLRGYGTWRERPLLPTRAPPLDQLSLWNPR